MAADVVDTGAAEALYHGLRMTADEYFQLEEDGFWYELIDGVVCMSPSPLPRHQEVAAQIVVELGSFLRTHSVGKLYFEVDVHLGAGPMGGDLVYRPDVIFLRAEHAARCRDRIVGPPALVVEVVSNTSRRYDNVTKKADYERCGVAEYWIIDPERQTMTFYRLHEGRYIDAAPEGDRLASTAVPGFALDLARVRKAFQST